MSSGAQFTREHGPTITYAHVHIGVPERAREPRDAHGNTSTVAGAFPALAKTELLTLYFVKRINYVSYRARPRFCEPRPLRQGGHIPLRRH